MSNEETIAAAQKMIEDGNARELFKALSATLAQQEKAAESAAGAMYFRRAAKHAWDAGTQAMAGNLDG